MVVAVLVVSSGVVPVGVIMRMRVVFVPAAVIVMRERHALSASDRRKPLHRDGQGQQQHGKKAEERLTHQRAL